MNEGTFTEGYVLGRDSSGTNNEAFGGNGAWWIVVLFLFAFLGRGFGGGIGNCDTANNGNGGGIVYGVDASMQRGFDTASITSGLNSIGNGICDATFSLNNSIMSGFNATQMGMCQGFNGVQQQMSNLGFQMQDCCCKTQRAIDALNYNMATQFCNLGQLITNNTRDVIENANANYRSLHDENVAYRLEQKNEVINALHQRITQLEFLQSQNAQSAYIVSQLRTTTPTTTS